MTMTGALPPSSMENRLMEVEEAWAMARRPVSLEPMRVIMLGMVLVFSSSATTPDGPQRMLSTPLGRPIRAATSPRYCLGTWMVVRGGSVTLPMGRLSNPTRETSSGMR